MTLYFGIDTILQGSSIGYEFQLERFSARQVALNSIRNHVTAQILPGLLAADPDLYMQAIEDLRDVIRTIREDTYYEPN